MIGIYIHIPYCRTLCPYCDFVRTPVPGQVPETFVDALCREIQDFSGPGEADTVFLGGGTPSLLSPASLCRILDAVRAWFRMATPEISIEANPDDVTLDLVQGWTDAGVNRVSLGVQSFDDAVLRYLGRRHDAASARAVCETVSAHFDNWSLDLMFGAQPQEAWPKTLDECLRLAPKHVSVYGLTYEPSTPFGARSDEAIDEDGYLEAYWLADERLGAYDHYEVSNYAQTGLECRHNLKYWRNEEYAGFGPGAFSFIDGTRSRNAVDAGKYVEAPGHKVEALHLSPGEIQTETLIQHFRLRTGLSKVYYRRRFGQDVRDTFGPQLDALIARGLLVETGDAIGPTRNGFALNNEIGLGLVG
ncbi:MAG: radical SAM family heme chaperone HemW [bacterium]|nr:radical SAM family heme chaperone HemW [bacterium]